MNPHRRILKLQRQILFSIRADVRKFLGPQSKDIKKYYGSYKREFLRGFKHSSRAELIRDCLQSDIILTGDYHTFSQSQKTAVTLLSELINCEVSLAIGLEMIPSCYQEEVNRYLAGHFSDEQFLEAIDYEKNWGFPWEQFQPIFRFAKAHTLEIIALNKKVDSLQERDEHAAEIISQWSAFHSKKKIFVLYGDLHLAQGHLPKTLKIKLREQSIKRKLCVVFQNSEHLYWKLAEKKAEQSIDVVSLGKNRFCIINAAPWVKLQSFLQWAETKSTYENDDITDSHIYDSLMRFYVDLSKILELTNTSFPEVTIRSVDDLSFLNKSGPLGRFDRNQYKIIRWNVLANKTLFIPDAGIVYLSSYSINSVAEAAVCILLSMSTKQNLMIEPFSENFYQAVIRYALVYFGSKILNHKRKCDLEDDLRLFLETKPSPQSLPQEKLRYQVAKQVLKHCRAQKTYLKVKRYRAPTEFKGPKKISMFFEVTRTLGSILGERLYSGFIAGTYPAAFVTEHFTTRLDKSIKAKKLYLDMVSALASAPLTATSKQDFF